MRHRAWKTMTVLVCLCAASGCGGPKPDGDKKSSGQTPKEAKAADEHGHDHDRPGPHGGRVLVLGADAFHAELVHDQDAHKVTVFLAEANSGKPVAADAPGVSIQLLQGGDFVSYTLAPAEGGGPGEYSLASGPLCDALAHGEDVKGRIRAAIGGEQVSGEIEGCGHEHDQEKDGGDDHEGHEHD